MGYTPQNFHVLDELGDYHKGSYRRGCFNLAIEDYSRNEFRQDVANKYE
jgi:hypothetical protein